MIQIDVGISKGMVCATLGDEPVNYLNMSPGEARDFAQNLIEVADLISPKKSSILFKPLHNAIDDLMSLRKQD